MKKPIRPRLKSISLDQVFRALGDPIRLSIVHQLIVIAGEEKACGTFSYRVSKATFSHHLKILRDAGITQNRREGTRRMVSLRSAQVERRFPGLLALLKSSSSRGGGRGAPLGAPRDGI